MGPAKACCSLGRRRTRFPPLRRGGKGGWPRRNASFHLLTQSSLEFCLQPLSQTPSARVPPPLPPLHKGGKMRKRNREDRPEGGGCFQHQPPASRAALPGS